MIRKWLGIAGLLVLLSCSKGPAAEEEAPLDRLEIGNPCSITAECKEGLACDASRKVCICVSDLACPTDATCHPVTGNCIRRLPGCVVDQDCPTGQFCDEANRVCRQLQAFCQPCERDGACEGQDSKCLAGGFCGKKCALDADCRDGQSASHRIRCVAGQCTPSLRCYESTGAETGRCIEPCVTDADCPGREEGDRCELGLCLQRIGCEDLVACVPDSLWPCARDGDCTRGRDQVCEGGTCVARRSGCAYSESCDPVTFTCEPSCTVQRDCRPGRVCVAGSCRPPERCTLDDDCAMGKICIFPVGWEKGECKPECVDDADCPLRMVCKEERKRRSCKAGCAQDLDCLPSERCNSTSGTCEKVGNACQITALCPPCESCRGGRCELAFDAARPEQRYCAACAEGDGSSCGVGGVCLAGRCAPSCPEEGCPSGFACELIDAGDDGELLRGCLPLDGICDTECI